MGLSYYHVHQPIGRHITTERVSGYYNNFTEKANWAGKSDNNGIPLNVLSNNKIVYFPITISQMALGNYDLWLEKGEPEKKNTFLKLARWLKENQDERGGWENPWRYLKPSSVTNYSAMAQGEAISVAVRAYLLTEDQSFLDCSRRAYTLMMKPVEQGGCCYYLKDKVYLEEYPENPRSTVLNGWIYAIFGIYDLMLITGSHNVKEVFVNTIKTLEDSLQSYDTGYWSYYDLYGDIASPFYHTLHIALLEALYTITGAQKFYEFLTLWNGYEKSFLNRSRALTVKALQRLKNPAKVTIVQ